MKILFAFMLAAGAALPVLAQEENRRAPLASLVATERAFSRMSEEKGIREAFAEFIADDGVLFRPRAVAGKKWMQEHPLPSSSTRPRLTWQPIFAAISRAGDLGYTTGPWQYKNDIKDTKPSAFGNFMTVWKRQPDGRWKFEVDLGISNPEPKTASATWHPPASTARTRFTRVNMATARDELLRAEREFSKASSEQGAAGAFLLYADREVRVFRNGKMPFVGRRSAVTAMPPLSRAWTWTPAFADISVSGDLGYTYGSYEMREQTGKRDLIESGNYVRVWKKTRGAWAVVIDVANPLPPEKKD